MNNIIIFILLLAAGYIFGKRNEKKHFKSLQERERFLSTLPTSSRLKKYKSSRPIQEARLVQGAVVISIDFFKKTIAALVNFFGGNVTAYESLIERARREAILRLKESCPDADEIINLRIETSSIAKGDNSIGSIEVLAYATAIYLEK